MLSQKAGKVVWHSYLFKNILRFAVIHTVKGFSVANEAEIDIFLEFPCFFHDPMDVGNLISGSSAFSKSSLNIWKFTVHLLLKAGLKDFEHYLARMCNDCSCAAVWAFFGFATSFKRTYAITDPKAGHCWPTPPQGTPGPSQASLAQFLVGSLLLSPGSWCTQGLVCALQESCPSRTIDRVSWYCTGGGDQNYSQGKKKCKWQNGCLRRPYK